MKNSILPVTLLFFLFGLFLNPSALASDGLFGGSSVNSNSSLVMCDVPSWQTTTNITETSAKFNWSEVYGAYSYSV